MSEENLQILICLWCDCDVKFCSSSFFLENLRTGTFTCGVPESREPGEELEGSVSHEALESGAVVLAEGQHEGGRVGPRRVEIRHGEGKARVFGRRSAADGQLVDEPVSQKLRATKQAPRIKDYRKQSVYV